MKMTAALFLLSLGLLAACAPTARITADAAPGAVFDKRAPIYIVQDQDTTPREKRFIDVLGGRMTAQGFALANRPENARLHLVLRVRDVTTYVEDFPDARFDAWGYPRGPYWRGWAYDPWYYDRWAYGRGGWGFGFGWEYPGPVAFRAITFTRASLTLLTVSAGAPGKDYERSQIWAGSVEAPPRRFEAQADQAFDALLGEFGQTVRRRAPLVPPQG